MRATILFLIWIALTIIGLSRLSFNVEVAAMLPKTLPEARGIQQLYEHFSREDELIVVISTPDAESATECARSLAKRFDDRTDLVRAAIWHLPFEEKPELAADLLAWLWLNGPPEALDDLGAKLAEGSSEETLQQSLEELSTGFLDESVIVRSYDPLGFTDLPGGLRESAGLSENDRLFASSDGTMRIVYLEAPEGGFDGYRETADWIASIRGEISGWRKVEDVGPETEILLTGEPAFVAEISTAMERDMKGSAIATILLIALLFWLWYRRLKPLLWLMLMLGLIFSGTFAVGGVVFGQLTAMSIGFAAILLGLAVDYGVVLFRERNAAPGDPAKLRRLIGPSILWAAATTAAVFATLNLASLPGIAELGTLVAIGTAIGAGVMLGFFAPVAARNADGDAFDGEPENHAARVSGKPALIFTGVMILAGVVTVWVAGIPELRREAKPFELRESESFTSMEAMQNGLGSGRENAPPSLPIVLTANRWSGLVDRVDEARQRLDATVKAGDIANYLLPTTLIPNPTHQAANLDRIRRLAGERDRFVAEILAAGFTEEATALTRSITDSWGKLANATPQTGSGENWAMPQSDFGRWLIGRAVSSSDSGATFAAIGSVQPNHLKTDLEGHLLWAENVNDDGIQITGWEVLNPALESLVARDFRRVFLPMGVILTLMLVVVFRHLGDLLLALGTLAFSGLALVTLSRWIPAIEWNTFNLAALPILFGTGLDYAIHMIFALRRSNGELAPVRRGISQALLFCGFSTAIGFGSLAFAASEGLATLGLVCAIGILLNMLAAIWLLPHWWRWSRRRVAP